jgi:hypothetical protein
MSHSTKQLANRMAGMLRYQYQRLKQYPHYRDEMKKIQERKEGKIPPQFQKLQALQNSRKGERCFILGDISMLPDVMIRRLTEETTFGTAAILENASSNWKPTYLGIQNPAEYQKIEQEARANYHGSIFVGDNVTERFAISDACIPFPYLGVYKYYRNRYGEYRTEFSENAAVVVYDGYHVVYSMLQIAVFMGLKEIYLIGCDCCHSQDKRRMEGYRTAKSFADSHGILLCNSTPNEEEDLLPYRCLTDILQ